MLNLTPVTEQHVLDNPVKQFIAVEKYGDEIWGYTVKSTADGGMLIHDAYCEDWINYSHDQKYKVVFYGEK